MSGVSNASIAFPRRFQKIKISGFGSGTVARFCCHRLLRTAIRVSTQRNVNLRREVHPCCKPATCALQRASIPYGYQV
eukprot:5388301-Amphidinium_carterae.2